MDYGKQALLKSNDIEEQVGVLTNEIYKLNKSKYKVTKDNKQLQTIYNATSTIDIGTLKIEKNGLATIDFIIYGKGTTANVGNLSIKIKNNSVVIDTFSFDYVNTSNAYILPMLCSNNQSYTLALYIELSNNSVPYYIERVITKISGYDFTFTSV